MKKVGIALVTMAFLFSGCSNPLGDGRKGSQLNDGYTPGQPPTINPTPQSENLNPSISAASNETLQGTTTSAKVKIQNKGKNLKGSSVSAAVSIK